MTVSYLEGMLLLDLCGFTPRFSAPAVPPPPPACRSPGPVPGRMLLRDDCADISRRRCGIDFYFSFVLPRSAFSLHKNATECSPPVLFVSWV
jgi:hypothetical protein